MTRKISVLVVALFVAVVCLPQVVLADTLLMNGDLSAVTYSGFPNGFPDSWEKLSYGGQTNPKTNSPDGHCFSLTVNAGIGQNTSWAIQEGDVFDLSIMAANGYATPQSGENVRVKLMAGTTTAATIIKDSTWAPLGSTGGDAMVTGGALTGPGTVQWSTYTASYTATAADAAKWTGKTFRIEVTSGGGRNPWAEVDNIVVNATRAATPEPGTLVLLGTGLVGLLAYAWRKRK